MPSKTSTYLQLAEDTARRITGSIEGWTGFLDTSSRLYKYPYHEQLMIYAQRPDATACASYELWNNAMGRYVRRGAKGIALLETAGEYVHLKYVFDVSDTGGRANARTPNLWQMQERHEAPVAQMLEEAYDVAASNGLARQFQMTAAHLAGEYWQEHGKDILGIVDGSFLADYDELNKEVSFHLAASASITYSLMKRCGLQTEGLLEREDFVPVLDWNTPSAAGALGKAVSQISEQVLRQIERTIKDAERSYEYDELQAGRRLSDSRSEPEHSADASAEQVRQDAQDVPAGAAPDPDERSAAERKAGRPSQGDRQRGADEAGADDERADAAGGDHGRDEGARSDGMDAADEQLEDAGGGSDPQRADLQLNFLDSSMQGMFLMEAEQIEQIDMAESADRAPFASFFSQEEVDHVLRVGGNQSSMRMRVAAEFMKQKSVEEHAAFLNATFKNGNGVKVGDRQIAAWYLEDGIHLALGKTARYSRVAQTISWQDAAARIQTLLESGQYATNVELAEARGHEIERIADVLWYMRRDFSQEARDAGYLSSLSGIRGKGGYPAEVERVAALIADPDKRAVLIAELQTFAEDCRQNKELLRFGFHRPAEILRGLNDLNLQYREFETQMTEIPWVNEYITDDEIDADLSRGSDVAGGKGRIYAYFQEAHTQKEKLDFLKREYGIGGHSHALGGSDGGWEDHDGKGIRYRKTGCPEIRMSWPEAVKRIENLIRKDRYLTPKQKEEWLALREAHEELEDGQTEKKPEKVPADPIDAEPDAQNQILEAETGANAPEAQAPQTPEGNYAYRVGDRVYLEQTLYEITDLRFSDVQLLDPTMMYPIFRSENRERFEQMLAMDARNDHLRVVDSAVQVEAAAEPAYPRYLVVAYHHFENGFDAKLDYPTLEEAERVAQGYVNGTMESDGFAYDGAAVYDQQEHRYLRIYGDYPDQNAMNQVAAEHQQPVVSDAPPVLEAQVAIPAENFRITDDHLGEGGAKTKFRRNMDAIHLLKKLESENRQATQVEQEILSQYVGWGGLPDAFDEEKPAWASEVKELREALTPQEYEAARASTLNAHYTSPTVIRAIYEAVGNMGFQTGNILEPAMGVGNFFGMMPENMRDSRLYGVELDSITGRIAKQLYPKADITVAGFETTDRRDFFDLAIGNVPFGNYKVDDRAYNKLGFSIHDYFFAKTLDQVRPGGVIAFVTSRYTMDKQSPEVRKYIAQRAELLGAIRLPNNAFKANAGTDVVSDIIFLQKRDRPLDIEPDWVHLGKNADGYGINSYFIDHPEMVLGIQTSESTQYGRQDFTVAPMEGADLASQLHEAVQHIHGSYQEAELPDLGEGEVIDTSIPADPSVKNYSYTVVDGEVYYRENSRMVRPQLSLAAKERVKGMVQLRDCVHQLIDAQLEEHSNEEIRQRQAELNALYDAFSEKHGLINDRANRLAFSDDSSYYLLCSLEVLDDEGRLKRKADMFTRRTIRQQVSVDHVDTSAEALAVSIGERARVDLPFMESLTGKTREQIVSDLIGMIFRLPVSPNDDPQYVTADEYLSGNVREKLREAKRAAEKDSAFLSNVRALEAAQPKDLEASEIDVRLGATWIDKEYIQAFMYELLGTPYYQRRAIEVHYSPHTAEWNISGKSVVSTTNVAAYTTYGTGRVNAYKILEDTLNLRDVRIYDTIEDADGKEKRVLNQQATTIAQQKQQAIKDAFRDWIWKDPHRRQALVTEYNERFNAVRPREYDGSHITFSGMNPEITLREHQRNAVAHVLYGGNTLLAHQVGAGKTFEMVAAAMESKRLGLCQKSMFVVPNHLTEQWASEFLRLYPSAKILVTTKKDFEKSRRKKFCARIATGDYDAVIIGHSQFEKIPISHERQERLLQEQIWEIMEGIEELKRSSGERFSIKQLERSKKQLETRLQKLKAEDRKDDVVTFEQLGVDRLYVDEAHAYKNLFLFTKMRNVAGLSTSEAQKSSDMFLKCRYLDELTGGRGVIFATGTPVSNSMTELYTMQRYLQYETLKRNSMTHFDCWASTFGETTTAIELAPEGTGYRARTRFAKFFNLPELMTVFKEVADIKTADQLHLPTPEAHYETVVVQPTEQQEEMVAALSERAADVHSGSVDPSVDNMLNITSDGRKLGLDQRLINPLLPDDPESKVNACVRNVHRIWQDGQADRLTQLIFCDISTPKAGSAATPLERLGEQEGEKGNSFSVYDDIRSKLINMGVPPEEIAFIHDADTEVKKKELFAKVRSGQVRVLIGSTAKMGAGTNVQDRLVASHDLDCPWRPGDLEQRAGRIVRQGNMNKDVTIYRYVTEGTFDAYLWQTVENKQRFISQIMTSKSPVRSCDDVDETALSYAEIKALCAGDPRIKEKMDLDVDVARLKLMKADHQSRQYRLEDQLLRYFPQEIEQHTAMIAGFTKDIETAAAHPVPEKDFVGMEIRGKQIMDKERAGAMIIAACKEAVSGKPMPLGNYRGFAMTLEYEPFAQHVMLTLKGEMSHRVELGTDPRGNLTRIENALAGIPQRMERAKAQLENLQQQRDAAKTEAGKAFPQEAELREKSARLAELDASLNIDKGSKTDRREHVAKKPSVLEQLKAPCRSGSTKRHRETEAR